jgi:hypothetical protein
MTKAKKNLNYAEAKTLLIFALFFSISRVCTNLFVVLLERRKILACLGVLALSESCIMSASAIIGSTADLHISSIPSPTYQCTKAHLEYMRLRL